MQILQGRQRFRPVRKLQYQKYMDSEGRYFPAWCFAQSQKLHRNSAVLTAEKILNYRAVCRAIAYIFVAIVGFLGIFGKLRGAEVQTAAKKVSLYPNVILSVV